MVPLTPTGIAEESTTLRALPDKEYDVEVVRILHISDTHGLHRQVEDLFPMPEADLLIHTGDFTDSGLREEFADFDAWLGELKERYPHRVVIFGNHEYKHKHDPSLNKRLISNATVLEHELVEILGLRIFGSAWVPGHKSGAPGDFGSVAHRFDEIPEKTDILLSHGSPYGIMDCCEMGNIQWGGSMALLREVHRARPRAHLFGHMHEQRGVWCHELGQPFQGGIEYELTKGAVHQTWAAPPVDYPCQLLSCNAMKNHPNIDRSVGKSFESRIAGGGRLILAERHVGKNDGWHFHVPSLNSCSARGGS